MAKIDLRFLDYWNDNDYVKVTERDNTIIINTFSNEDGLFTTTYLDKSTAIRFSKALRTAINQIK